MRLFDTHCHFETDDANEIAAICERAKASGVVRMLAVGGSVKLNRSAAMASPIFALGYDRDQIDAPRPPVGDCRAIGEIGLDYHYSPETRKQQLSLFAEQLDEARRRDLPVIIHTREAADDTLSLLKEIPSRGIIHCFTGTPDEARGYLDLGFFVSISGIVTFKAADNVRVTARYVPDDRVLIETDSPYLAPVPYRGRPNEPAFLVATCEFLAALRGMTAESFAALTFANAERIVG